MPAADLALALMHEAIAEGKPECLEQLAAPRVMAFLTSNLLVRARTALTVGLALPPLGELWRLLCGGEQAWADSRRWL